MITDDQDPMAKRSTSRGDVSQNEHSEGVETKASASAQEAQLPPTPARGDKPFIDSVSEAHGLEPPGGALELYADSRTVERLTNQDHVDEDGKPIGNKPSSVSAIVPRNLSEIIKEHEECREKVWWMEFRHMLEPGRRQGAIDPAVLEKADAALAVVEAKYGRSALEELLADDKQYAMIFGRYTALGWVLGPSWEKAEEF